MNNFIVKQRSELNLSSLWQQFHQWTSNTNNPIAFDWLGTLAMPTLLAATICSILALTIAPHLDIDDIREPIIASLYCK